MIGIYMILNNINGHAYIGQSKNIETRIQKHIYSLTNNYHHNQHLQNAWNKYGKGNFNFFILEKCNKALLDDAEIFWISFLGTYNNGYNLTPGGDFCPMKVPEIVKKISGKNNGMYNVRKYREDNPFYGKKHSQKTRKKISESISGIKNPRAKYKLWDINSCHYKLNDMTKRGRKPNPCKCFVLKYNGYHVPIGGFIDFYTPELLYNLTKEFIST